MKYLKGTQKYTIDECSMRKLLLRDNEDFSETPWVGVFDSERESVLLNHAIAFTPHESWGAVIPALGSFNFIETLEKQELTLHPEAWDKYIEFGIIDSDGNYVDKENRNPNI